MQTIQAVVLAGGGGGRLNHLTGNTQKCLLMIDDKPILAHIIDALVEAFRSVDLIVGVAHGAEDVKAFINHNKPSSVSVTYIPHVPGTEGWGIYRAMRPHIHGSFVAMPGDIIALPQVYSSALSKFEEGATDGVITLSPNIDVIDTHGVGYISNGLVSALQWPPPQELPANCLRDMTIWSSDARIFNIIEQYPNPGKSIGYVFMDAVRDGRPIAGNYYDAPWIHLGVPDDLQKSFRTLCRKPPYS